LIYPGPSACAVCDNESMHASIALCRHCFQQLNLLAPPLCARCGRLLRLSAADARNCRECAKEKLFFSQARAVCLYDGAVRAYLHEVKYNRALVLARALAGVLAAYAREHAGYYRRYRIVIPVPLHVAKIGERGFNQADVLAKAVGQALRRPVHSRLLQRTRQTETQSRLIRDHRRDNVREAFRVTEPNLLNGRGVLLIDDILTTGFTASECARAMLSSGAAEVGVLTLANGVLEEEWLGG